MTHRRRSSTRRARRSDVKLKRLAINRLPGISQPYEIEAAGAGLHVVFGPNGIGKSSVCRALEGLYWEDLHPSPLTSVAAEFEWDGESWWGQRNGRRATWQRGVERNVSPNLPPSHNHRCFFLRLRDLIEPSRDGAADVAAEIRRQTSGGFDLHKIASDLFSGVSVHLRRRQRRDFGSASDEVQKAAVRHANLQRRADELASLRRQLHEAEDAARRVVFVERAIGLARRREELAGIIGRIEALPRVLAKLTGKEVEEVERYQQQADMLAERMRFLEQELGRTREARRQTGLDSPMNQTDLAAWRENADELSRIELELDAATTERNATRRALAAALSAVGGGVSAPAFTLSEHRDLFAFLRSSQEHSARAAAIRERLRQLDRFGPAQDHERELERFRGGVETLHAWLRVPEPEDAAVRVRSRWPWLLLAIALMLAGAGLVFVAPPPGLLEVPGLEGSLASNPAPRLRVLAQLLAGMGIGAGMGTTMAVLLLGDRRRSQDARRAARAAYDLLGLEEPSEWNLPSVESRLSSLKRETADIEVSMGQARDRELERQRLETELEGLSEPEAALDARRQEIKEELGLNTLPPDAELVDYARALDQLRLARRDDEAAAGKLEALEQRHGGLLSGLAGVLEASGEPELEDGAIAKARIHHLADRNSRLEQALHDERTMTAQIEENAADREAALHSIRRIYAEAGLGEGDLNGLRSLAGSLEGYRELIGEKTRLEGQIDLDRAELAQAGAGEWTESDVPSLERLKDEFSDLETRAGELRNEVAEITAGMEEARSGKGMQDLIAVREAARVKLSELRNDALYAKAGGFLMDSVEEEYEHTRMPRVFERARDHFFEFTHHNYKLELGKDGDAPRLFARESRGGEAQDLDELSDGTRVQLLLAARLAFAEEVEQGKILPLFLDEALDQSDPRRFEAMVRSLGRVARDQGRQIFYLTSDPLDIDRIRDALGKEGCDIAAEIDLGLIRTKAVSVGGPQALRVDPGPTVPAPDGRSPEEYGAALDVPAFRPELGYAAQHFFYVLWDDPDLLYDCLLNGIERAGQWRTVAGTSLAERLGSLSISPADITARLDLLKAFCELWLQGRGRTVGREVLEESEALTDRYLDDVVAIARDLEGDAKRLVAALDGNQDPRLRGFRKSNVERLQLYLAETGYLDDRPVLDEDDLRLRAQITPAAGRLPVGIANDCLRRWYAWAGRSSESKTG